MSMLLGALAGLAAHGWPAVHADSSGVDLVVSSIVPSATEPPKVLVIVRNMGTGTVRRGVVVELKLDGQVIDEGRTQKALEPRKPVFVELVRPTEMPHGLHSFTATIDPQDEIRELNEQNNETSTTIWVKGGKEEKDEDVDRTRPGRRRSTNRRMREGAGP